MKFTILVNVFFYLNNRETLPATTKNKIQNTFKYLSIYTYIPIIHYIIIAEKTIKCNVKFVKNKLIQLK